ncbi:hypothetical protein Dsin_017334 [Dipteronia sinensis]|uniref:RRM domain-containing protein n=1 Tax=Dipteronia sinensis TaxID=43782 RepID=A0AAE0AFI5_9ROSI|nr:hypothetical protein Dsin_017334 [Dipteronia sinensis]
MERSRRLDARPRDFRSGLFSIFVDNLNPRVDLMGLWSIFKPFGTVRDVFLSSKKSGRKSCYTFVRFASKAEASKVANRTNDKHVYSWPISSKVATYEWKDRQSTMPRGHRVNTQDNVSRHQVNDGSKNIVNYMQGSQRAKHSYVEVVNDYWRTADEGNETEEVYKPSMTWEGIPNEDSWLSECAIDSLKGFQDVSSVNARLSDRGIGFFLGGLFLLNGEMVLVDSASHKTSVGRDYWGSIGVLECFFLLKGGASSRRFLNDRRQYATEKEIGQSQAIDSNAFSSSLP